VITLDRQKIDDRTSIRGADESRRTERVHIYIYGERGERSGDPINSNGDEDIPNLSAIYRE